MLKINEWSVNRRIESLRQMDKMLSEMNVGSRYTIWQEYGGGLKANPDDTHANWKRIAEDDELYQNAIFCYMCCTLEKYTLQNFNVKEQSANQGKGQLCPFTKAKLYAKIGGE